MGVTTHGNIAYRAGVKNPTPVINLLDSWIGFSEQWDPSKLGVGTPISTYTPADTPKRDAVGAAFKVRVLFLVNKICTV